MLSSRLSATLEEAAADPVVFGEAFLDWKAFPAQAAWLRGSTLPQNWCRAGNRWGKTESIAIKHLWKCTFKHRSVVHSYHDPYETVNTSLSLDQAGLPLNKAWRLLHRPAAQMYREAFIRRMVQTPFPRIEFNNGSTWWARSTVRKGKYLEGKDYDYASNDEGAFDPDLGYLIDEVLSLRLIDRGGRLDAISTGRRGSEFNRRYEVAQRDFNQFAYQGRTIDNPHLDRAALDRVIERLPPGLVEERIYGGERPSDGRIPYDQIIAASQKHKASASAAMEDPVSGGRRYSTGWDLARSRNFTAGVTLDITEQPYQLVDWEMFNQQTLNLPEEDSYWAYVYERIRLRHRRYEGLTQIDATGIGSVVSDHLSEIGAEAIVFTGQKLQELIGCLELAFGLGVIGIPLLEMQLPDDRTWTLIDELEEVSEELSGLDMATALGLSLWGIRAELQGQIPYVVASRVATFRR